MCCYILREKATCRYWFLDLNDCGFRLHPDMESKPHNFDMKFDRLIRDVFEYRAALSDLNNRVDKPEEKAY